MNWEDAVRSLFALERRGIKLELTRMRACLDDLGRPQDSFASILVAGTNGKGSVSAALASVLACGGRSVGLYTSPHLIDFRERIRIQGRMADPALLLRIFERDRLVWEKHQLSFFEAATALAFCAFREAGVPAAVLEVGLGGRLDATNTVEPILSVITSMGMDHAYLLGATPAAIALEKAGIMRPGIPVALAGGGSEATGALLRRAAELKAPAFLRRDCLRLERLEHGAQGLSFHLGLRAGAPSGFDLPPGGLDLQTSLAGVHQATNASLAVLALGLLRAEGWKVAEDEIVRGFRRLRWPGRLERPLPGTPMLADVAHNREGAQVLARALHGEARRREIRPVVGMLQQKDHAGFFLELRRIAGTVRIAPLEEQRAAPPEELEAAAAAAGFRVLKQPSVAAGLRQALAGAADPDGPLVLLCGSFHTLDEGYRELGISPLEALWEEEAA